MSRPSKVDAGAKLALREKSQNMEKYLNRLEEIFSSYSVAEQNGDKITEISMLTGKIMICFSEICALAKVYED